MKPHIYQGKLEADIRKEICHQNGLLYLDRNNNKKIKEKDTQSGARCTQIKKETAKGPMYKKADLKLRQGFKRRFRVTVFLSLHLTDQSV